MRLAGRLSIAQIPELLRSCEKAEALELDLSELVAVDVAGIEALQRVRASGARLIGASGYIQLKLDSPTAGILSSFPAKGRPI